MRRSKVLSDRAADFRKIATQSKTRIARNVATKIAEEKDRQAADAKKQEHARVAAEH